MPFGENPSRLRKEHAQAAGRAGACAAGAVPALVALLGSTHADVQVRQPGTAQLEVRGDQPPKAHILVHELGLFRRARLPAGSPKLRARSPTVWLQASAEELMASR